MNLHRRVAFTAVVCLTLIFMAVPLKLLFGQSGPGLPATEQVRVLHQNNANRYDFAVHPTDPQILYWVVQSVGVLKSTDGGATWIPKNSGLPIVAVNRIAMHPDDPDHLMVGFDGHFASQGAPPYRSLDGGERWEPTVVCEREDGRMNLRQQGSTERLAFDPTESNRFYYLVHSQFDACGGFYRSCDEGASYDRNPRCISEPEPRPVCTAGDPEPVNNITSNDASILEVHTGSGDLYGTTGVHAEECALMTSSDKGGYWTWEDVVDTRGTFIDPAEQGAGGLYLYRLGLAP
jgi:hypothetical protein